MNAPRGAAAMKPLLTAISLSVAEAWLGMAQALARLHGALDEDLQAHRPRGRLEAVETSPPTARARHA